MYGDPATWHRLCALLAEVAAAHLRAQAEAGCQALQVFDSWVGALDESDYSEFVLPHVSELFARLRGLDVPVVHFGTGAGHLLERLRDAGGDVLGLDWRTPLDEASRRLGPRVALQGNLDPALLLGPLDRLLHRVDDVLARAGGREGHVFNAGHGVLPGTPVANVRAVVEHVHARTVRGATA
jgi:uroporphyrinogen decarboxylase